MYFNNSIFPPGTLSTQTCIDIHREYHENCRQD